MNIVYVLQSNATKGLGKYFGANYDASYFQPSGTFEISQYADIEH